MLSDDDYVAGLHGGDEKVFTAMVYAYVEPLTKFAFGYTGEEDTAHDIVQDVFTRVWQLGSDWNPHRGVAPYLFGSVRHRAYDVMRADHARERMRQAVRVEREVGMDDRDPYGDPALVALVRRELQQLTDRQRDALRLRYEQGYTMAQAAEILGIDVSAAEKLVARGFTTLRARLAEFRKRL